MQTRMQREAAKQIAEQLQEDEQQQLIMETSGNQAEQSLQELAAKRKKAL